MTSEAEYQSWLKAKRAEVPPARMVEQIMAVVRDEVNSNATAHAAIEPRPSVWKRAVPYLVCSAAVVVLAVRLCSIVGLFVLPTSIADVALIESEQENLHD